MQFAICGQVFFVAAYLYQKWLFIIMLCFEVNVQVF